jgi:MraZ protein
VFRGITSVNLDAKGRMALPSRYRDAWSACDGKLVLTIDSRERCLLLYPTPEWDAVQAKLEGLSNLRKPARLLQRLLIGHATDVDIDGSGRVLIPPMLREFASLTKKLVLLGQGNKVEVWSDALWQERLGEWLKAPPTDELDADDYSGLSL